MGSGEKAFQIAVAVVVEDGYRIARFHSLLAQGVGQPVDPFIELAVGVAHLVAVDDFLIRGVDERGVQQFFDDQRIRIGFSGIKSLVGHGPTPPFVFRWGLPGCAPLRPIWRTFFERKFIFKTQFQALSTGNRLNRQFPVQPKWIH